MNIVSVINKVIAPLKRSINLMIGRAVVTLINDNTGIQSLQAAGLSGELLADIERFQDYGFTSVPIPGSEALLVFPSGNRDHAIAAKVDDRKFRPTGLNPGETCIYDFAGNMVIIKAGEIEVKHAVKVNISSPMVDVGSGTLEKILNGETFQSFFNAHTHVDSLGGKTTPPIIPSNVFHLSATVKATKGI